MIIPKEQRLGYEYRNYHHYAAIILELGTVGKILVTASILDLSNFNILHVLHPYNLNLRMEDDARNLGKTKKDGVNIRRSHVTARYFQSNSMSSGVFKAVTTGN